MPNVPSQPHDLFHLLDKCDKKHLADDIDDFRRQISDREYYTIVEQDELLENTYRAEGGQQRIRGKIYAPLWEDEKLARSVMKNELDRDEYGIMEITGEEFKYLG